MKKKLLTVLLFVFSLSFLIGCGSNDKSNADQEKSTSDQTQEVSQDPTNEAENNTAEEAAPEPATESNDKTFVVGISQIADHPALDSAREGFMKALEDKGLEVKYDYSNAQGDMENLKAISANFVSKKVDLILAVATNAAQSAFNETNEIPVLFTAVTDPVDAGIVKQVVQPGENVSGTSDLNPINKQVEFIKELIPDIKKLGVIYTSSESNSKIQADIAVGVAQDLGIETEVATINAVADIAIIGESLFSSVDAVYIPTDNTIAAAMANVAQVAERAKTPVFAADPGMTQEGGLATIGINYYELGYETGLMAYEVLANGVDIGTMDVRYSDPENAEYYLNQRTADAIGFEFSQEVKNKAKEIWTE